MLPDIEGLEICKLLKKEEDMENIPIIMLTAKTDESDIIIGLELGADDYMLKPFSVKELLSRIKAVLRRSNIKTDIISDINKNDTIEIDNLIKIDLNLHSVFVSDKEIELTKTQFDILIILCRKRGWIFSREVLLDKLWGSDKFVIDRTIDVHIKHLRDKLGTAGTLIKNVRGVGYKI
jgi:two-component system phosphate regulon response regulator PhoB/two-component system alkaline phosphatase synthesis response regulator PhoP